MAAEADFLNFYWLCLTIALLDIRIPALQVEKPVPNVRYYLFDKVNVITNPGRFAKKWLQDLDVNVINLCGRARSHILAGEKPVPEGWPATG